MTTTETRTVPSRAAMPRPTHEEVVQVIVRDATAAGADCSEYTASCLVVMFENAIRKLRTYPEPDSAYQIPTSDLILEHDVLDAIMPDDVAVPRPGSAHDLLNRFHLRGPQECSFVHTEAGQDCYCAVRIKLWHVA